jgi:hypothetical protein
VLSVPGDEEKVTQGLPGPSNRPPIWGLTCENRPSSRPVRCIAVGRPSDERSSRTAPYVSR